VRAAAGLLALALVLLAVDASAQSSDMAGARRAFEQGRYDEARDALLQITRESSQSDTPREAWYYLALLTRPGDEYLRYLDLFLTHGGRKDPRGGEVELRAGRYFYTTGEYRNALVRFESARDIRRDAPAAAEARLWIGLTLMALREPTDARPALEEAALSKSPRPVREAAMFALGELFLGARDFPAAARAFSDYRDTFPQGNYVAASLLGEAMARERMNRKKEASDLYGAIVTRHPASPEAAQARAWLEAAKGPPPRPLPPRRESGPDTTASAGGDPGDTGSAAVDTTPIPVEVTGFGVQVGAFADRNNALSLAEDLIDRGYSRVRVERGTGEPRLYHVRFGNYPDQSAASRAGEEVSATLGVKFQIIPPAAPEGQ
jgi:tetratricopeptide (TPR) repeat protein